MSTLPLHLSARLTLLVSKIVDLPSWSYATNLYKPVPLIGWLSTNVYFFSLLEAIAAGTVRISWKFPFTLARWMTNCFVLNSFEVVHCNNTLSLSNLAVQFLRVTGK